MEQMLRVRRLDQVEVRQIYGTFMQEDFPKNEMKPLERILEMVEDNIYECTGLFAEGGLVAYAFFVKAEESGYYLLDYLAVNKECRGKGYGGRYLELMRYYFKYCNGIFLECESESVLGEWTPENHTTAVQRKKRIQFYRKNGVILTNIKSILFGVEFSVLYYPVKVRTGADWYGELENLYRTLLPGPVFDSSLTMWKRSSVMIAADRGVIADGAKILVPKVSLCDALGIKAQAESGELKMIALTGSGGKTTTMYQLADELAEMGRRVLVTTSTHIAVPGTGQCVRIDEAGELETVEWQGRILTAGRTADGEQGRKLKAPDNLGKCLEYADLVLVEADGSKQLPAKVEAAWEPVIPEEAQLVIGCFGLRAIGQTFGEVCFRFAECGGWLSKDAADVITAADAAQLLSDERGFRKNTGTRPYSVVLNQADGETERLAAVEVIQSLPEGSVCCAAVTCYDKGD